MDLTAEEFNEQCGLGEMLLWIKGGDGLPIHTVMPVRKAVDCNITSVNAFHAAQCRYTVMCRIEGQFDEHGAPVETPLPLSQLEFCSQTQFDDIMGILDER